VSDTVTCQAQSVSIARRESTKCAADAGLAGVGTPNALGEQMIRRESSWPSRSEGRIRGGSGPAWTRTSLQMELFSRPWVHRWGHATRIPGRIRHISLPSAGCFQAALTMTRGCRGRRGACVTQWAYVLMESRRSRRSEGTCLNRTTSGVRVIVSRGDQVLPDHHGRDIWSTIDERDQVCNLGTRAGTRLEHLDLDVVRKGQS
jgi:hypothetical protein